MASARTIHKMSRVDLVRIQDCLKSLIQAKQRGKSSTPVGIGEKTKTRTAKDGKHWKIHILHNDYPDKTGGMVNISELTQESFWI
jgi:hypothetical protein